MKARVTFFLPVLLALLLADVATTTRGQSALDGFDANAQNPSSPGSGFSCTVQPDGKILIGGGFQTILGVPRNSLARLNPDGTLDINFDAGLAAGSSIDAIVLQSDGKILIVGSFNTTGSQPRHDVARLDPVTGIPDSLTANTNNVVYAIALQADGKILVGGKFTNIGGQSRNYIARLDPVTGAVDSFNANAVSGSDRLIESIAIQRDGKILVGGAFHGIGGRMNNYIARLDPVTGLADSFDPAANFAVSSIALQPDSKILVGG